MKNKIVAGLCCLMLVSATLFAAGSAIADDDDPSWGSMMSLQSAGAITTGEMSILMMMPAILGAAKAGLQKMQQSVE